MPKDRTSFLLVFNIMQYFSQFCPSLTISYIVEINPLPPPSFSELYPTPHFGLEFLRFKSFNIIVIVRKDFYEVILTKKPYDQKWPLAYIT